MTGTLQKLTLQNSQIMGQYEEDLPISTVMKHNVWT